MLEGRHLGAAATGNTTAKVSLLQGTIASTIRAHHDDDAVRAYVQANVAGQQQVHELMDELGMAYQREAAYTYVNDERSLSTLEKEYDAASAAGLPVLWAETTEAAVPTAWPSRPRSTPTSARPAADPPPADPPPVLVAAPPVATLKESRPAQMAIAATP